MPKKANEDKKLKSVMQGLPLFLPPASPFPSATEGFLRVPAPYCLLTPASFMINSCSSFKSQYRIHVIPEAFIDASHALSC